MAHLIDDNIKTERHQNPKTVTTTDHHRSGNIIFRRPCRKDNIMLQSRTEEVDKDRCLSHIPLRTRPKSSNEHPLLLQTATRPSRFPCYVDSYQRSYPGMILCQYPYRCRTSERVNGGKDPKSIFFGHLCLADQFPHLVVPDLTHETNIHDPKEDLLSWSDLSKGDINSEVSPLLPSESLSSFSSIQHLRENDFVCDSAKPIPFRDCNDNFRNLILKHRCTWFLSHCSDQSRVASKGRESVISNERRFVHQSRITITCPKNEIIGGMHDDFESSSPPPSSLMLPLEKLGACPVYEKICQPLRRYGKLTQRVHEWRLHAPKPKNIDDSSKRKNATVWKGRNRKAKRTKRCVPIK
mmetsp:Transcript_29284/g.79270  ORF Transcript_29284/g.79270 Transcript_29284/m.79270 type:complete len:353 (-) Transcript_29284:136-1194(-)